MPNRSYEQNGPTATSKESLILSEMLAAKDRFASGSLLADRLGISRVAVWTHMEKLREQGFEFEAVRSKGYRIARYPDSLNQSLIQAMLPSHARDLLVTAHEALDSTNSEAERLLANGVSDPILVLSRKQTQGRGRFGREWHSPENGNLYASFAFRPRIPPARLSTFTLWIGVNICACLNSYFRIQSAVKWPNDIHIDGKKVAGILTEARMDSDHTRELILGVGLNINSAIDDWPSALQSIATSIRQATGKRADLNRFTAILAGRVYQAYDQFISDAYRSSLKEMWADYDLLQDRKISLIHGKSRISGTARGIDLHGSLVLEREDGSRVQIRAGEVTIEK
ncbi:MAG TPA: biotin--[acetyl-CoA-carboxylase] ligase [Opitutae bacterium]|nr:biotin--[acetyl-CoA-carboxylase] ligase [Opitutae bacterium]